MKKMLPIFIALSLAIVASVGVAQTEISLGRFFGDCEEAGTDIAAATGEACIIQTIINAFSAEDNGVVVNTLPTNWGDYYEQIKASYAGGNPPDVHVMHKSRLPEFANIGALAPIGEDLASIGVDSSDWSDGVRESVTMNGAVYGVPMDVHANLWHVNMDIMQAAGLVNDDGTPILPGSPEEMLAHAEQVKSATGHDYLAADFSQFPIGVRLVLAFVWQQGSNVFAGDAATVNTPEGQQAVETILSLFEGDYADPTLNYADSQQQFLDGEVAVLVNGTWVVDFYDAQAADPEVALEHYYAADFPSLFGEEATWADSHMWVIPASVMQDGERYEAALELLAFINEHNVDWARTGHLAVRESVLASDEYTNLPHRDEYANTVNIIRDVPPSENYAGIQDVLNRELQAIWLTGKPVEDALADADLEIEDLLR
jgi:multiple sugar transport system substrate-binding protein